MESTKSTPQLVTCCCVYFRLRVFDEMEITEPKNEVYTFDFVEYAAIAMNKIQRWILQTENASTSKYTQVVRNTTSELSSSVWLSHSTKSTLVGEPRVFDKIEGAGNQSWHVLFLCKFFLSIPSLLWSMHLPMRLGRIRFRRMNCRFALSCCIFNRVESKFDFDFLRIRRSRKLSTVQL